VFDWVGMFVMIAIGAGVWRGVANMRSWSRVLQSLPVTPAADLVEGRQVKFVGVVADSGAIDAPLTQRPCIGWTIREVRTGRIVRSAAGRFVVRDAAGGTVLVCGERAAMVLADGEGISAARVAGMVQRETLLRVGDEVTIVGMVRRELDPKSTAMYREPPTRLVLDGIPLWILSGRR
jgi:hypothetical protein